MTKVLLEQYEQLGFKPKTFSSRWTFEVITERSKINDFVNDQCISNLLNEIQKWLREVHKIHIYVIDNSEEFSSFVNKNVVYVHFKTYEEALEAGIKESLKYIKYE